VVTAAVVLRTSDKIVGLDYECNYSHNSSLVSSIASALGNRAAEFNKGLCLLEKKEYGEAYDAFVSAAEKGLAEAQSRLGYMYAKGLGVAKDLEKSEHWYWVAANQGNKDAMVSLGNIYHEGFEDYRIRKDFYKAFHYYSDAAYAGDAEAQFRLAFMYINGEGVEQDYKKAFEWLKKAAVQGYAPAQREIGGAYEQGGGGVEQDYNMAVEWYKKAAMQGDATAQNNMGVAYELGQGVEQDYNKAIEWYQKAAAQGLQVAQENLDRFYETPSADSEVESRDEELVDSSDGENQ
jgi:TPR repeat protein